MKTKEQFLLETHGDKDLNIDLVKKAMDLYANQQACKNGELRQAFKAGEIYAYDRQNNKPPVDFDEWYCGFLTHLKR